jgi:hypothetical protein
MTRAANAGQTISCHQSSTSRLKTDGTPENEDTKRSALRWRTPTLNLVQVRARLIEDADDLETAISFLPLDPTADSTRNLELIGQTAYRILRTLGAERGELFDDAGGDRSGARR